MNARAEARQRAGLLPLVPLSQLCCVSPPAAVVACAGEVELMRKIQLL